MGSAQGPVTSELEQARSAPEFGAHTPLAEKLLAVAIRAQNFTGSSGIAIALTEGQEMVCRANWGTSAPEVGAKLSREHGFTGLCVRRGEPLRCDDAQTDPRVDAEACQALGISAIAVAPVRRGLKVIGVIAAFSDTPHAFTDKHLLILTTLAEVIVELLDEPHPVRPLPQSLPDLARATAVTQAPVAPRVENPAVTSVAQEPATPPVQEIPPTASPSATDPGPPPPLSKNAPPASRGKAGLAAVDAGSSRLKLVKQPLSMPAPDFGPELTFSGFEADASPSRRWLLPAVILAIFALLAFAAWRWSVARNASMAKRASVAAAPVPEATPPQAELVQTSKPSAIETEPARVSPPAKAKVTSSPAKTVPAPEQLTEERDVTIRHNPQPVVEAAGPVRRPAIDASQTAPEAPQLAVAVPELPAVLAKPASVPVTGPVSRVVPAKLNRRVEPPYPDSARRLGISGKVVMKATITKTGAVASVQWVSGNELFRDTTIAAVKQWRYKPASLNGQPVESDLEIVLQFKNTPN